MSANLAVVCAEGIKEKWISPPPFCLQMYAYQCMMYPSSCNGNQQEIFLMYQVLGSVLARMNVMRCDCHLEWRTRVKDRMDFRLAAIQHHACWISIWVFWDWLSSLCTLDGVNGSCANYPKPTSLVQEATLCPLQLCGKNLDVVCNRSNY